MLFSVVTEEMQTKMGYHSQGSHLINRNIQYYPATISHNYSLSYIRVFLCDENKYDWIMTYLTFLVYEISLKLSSFPIAYSSTPETQHIEN